MLARVLLLEDDVAFAVDLKRALLQHGCEVTILNDGNEGIARAMSDRFDLVLIAAELDGMNGFRFCNRMKKNPTSKGVPIVLFWDEGSMNAVASHEKLPTRADGYVRKPFLPTDIVGQVRAFVPTLAKQRAPTLEDIPSFARGRRASGVEPAAALRARHPAAPPVPDAGRLQSELAAAQREMAAASEVRARLSQVEAENARLVRDLQQASARAARSEGEIAKGAADGRPEPATTRELLATRELVVRKDREIVALKAKLDAAEHEVEAKERALAASRATGASASTSAEASPRGAEAAQLARAEREAAALAADKELAVKRADDAQRRLQRVTKDLEAAREEAASSKQARAADASTHAQVLAEVNAELARERRGFEGRVARSLAARDAAWTQERARLDRENEAALSTLRAALEDKVTLAQAEAYAATTGLGTRLEEAREAADKRLRELETGHARRTGELERLLELARSEAAHEREARRVEAAAHADANAVLSAKHEHVLAETARQIMENQRRFATELQAIEAAHAVKIAEIEHSRDRALADGKEHAATIASARNEREERAKAATIASRRVTELEKALEAATAARAADTRALDDERRRAAQAHGESLEKLSEQLASTQRDLAAAKQWADGEIDTLATRLADVIAERDTARAELEKRTAGAERLEREMSAMAERHAAALGGARDSAREAARDTLATTRTEIERLNTLVAHTSRERDEARGALASERETRLRSEAERARAAQVELESRKLEGTAHDEEKARIVAAYEAKLAAERGARKVGEASHAQALSALGEERLAERSEWQAKERALQLAHERALASLRADHERAAAAARAESEKARIALETANRDERARLEAGHREALVAFEATLAASTEKGAEAIRRAQVDLATREAALAELERDRDALAIDARRHESRAEELSGALEKELAEAETERRTLAEERKAEAELHAKAVAALTSAREAERAEVVRRHEAELDQARREHEAAMTALDERRTKEHRGELSRLREQHTSELAATRRAAEEEISRALGRNEASAAAHAEDLARREKQHVEARWTLERELQASRRTLAESEAGARRAEVEAEERAARIEELHTARDSAEATARARAEEASELTRDLAAVRSALEGERVAREAERQALALDFSNRDAKLAEIRRESDASMAAARAELARALAERNEALRAGLAALDARSAEIEVLREARGAAEERASTLSRALDEARASAETEQRRRQAEREEHARVAAAREADRVAFERRAAELLDAHADALAVRNEAHRGEIAALVTDHEAVRAALAAELTLTASAFEDRKAEIAALGATATELRAAHEAALLGLEREQKRARDAERERDERVAGVERARNVLESELSESLREEKLARESAVADAQREVSRLADEHAAAITALQLAAVRERGEADRVHQSALVEARAAARAEALEQAEASFAGRLESLESEVRAEFRAREAELREAQDAARAMGADEHDSRTQALEARVADLTTIVARGREALDAERRDRLREEGETMLHIDELEARVATATEARERLRQEADDARGEVHALEAEIAALRAELLTLRSRAENDSVLLRAANEQLDRNRRLLDQAKSALAEIVDAERKDVSER